MLPLVVVPGFGSGGHGIVNEAIRDRINVLRAGALIGLND
jgi:hypothetical protein